MDTYSAANRALAYIHYKRRYRRCAHHGRKKYTRLNLQSLSDEKCKQKFRFTYSEIHRICEAIKLEKILQFNDLKVNRELAMAMLLYRYSFPRQLADMVDILGMSEDNLRRTINKLSDLLLSKFKYGLEFDERQFSKQNCERFSRAIFEKGAFYPHIVGFIDGTMQQVCRPKDAEDQNLMYNGWKHMQCNKFQAISTPDGITGSLSGPYVGKNNDRGMLNESQLLSRLSAHFEKISPDKEYAIYGDEAYWLSKHIIPPYRKPFKSDHEERTNKSMSKARIAVEMEFGKIAQFFGACKWKYGNKTNLTKPGMKYALSTVFKNIHTYIRRSATSSMFNLSPPTLEDYIDGLMRSRSDNDTIV